MGKFNAELLEKAKQAKSAEEILALAKENGMEMTGEQAAAYYAQMNPASGELSDDELDNVAGGGCGGSNDNIDNIDSLGLYGGERVCCLNQKCSKCGSQYGIFNFYTEAGFIVFWVDCESCGTEILQGTDDKNISTYIQKA